MKSIFFILLFGCTSFYTRTQTIPDERTVDWPLAGLTNGIPEFNNLVNINDHGGQADGITPNNTALAGAINALNNSSGVIIFGQGTYVFEQVISLSDNIILRGQGANATTLKFLTPSSGDLIEVSGTIENQQISVAQNAGKGGLFLVLEENHNLSQGDYIKLTLNDSSMVTSSWAYRTVGQIIKIASVTDDTIYLESPLRMDYPVHLNPRVRKINPRKNVGIECLKISRSTNDGFQSNNIFFQYSVESWVKGIESDSCNFAHITISNSSNIEIRNSYFHNAFDYGNGGKGYGIMIHHTAGECLVENNIFKKLRHSMILQAGANGNVFGYNYSTEPYWTGVSLPSNSAGDMVLHGNYAYANLFEGNIGQNIVIDDSHGQNGPYNTFFRNRADLYGIFMNNAPASDLQNIVGNEITNTGFLLGLYQINGNDHFLYGNNVKGTIHPSETQTLPDTSCYLQAKPAFLNEISQYPVIGPPNVISSSDNKAKLNYIAGTTSYCGTDSISSVGTETMNDNHSISISPNPTQGIISLEVNGKQFQEGKISIYNSTGNSICTKQLLHGSEKIDLRHFPTGVYLVNINIDGQVITRKFLKH